MKNITFNKLLIIVFATTLLSACSGGSDSPPPKNLSLTSLKVLTLDPEISYPMVFEVELESEVEGDQVSVSLYAVEKKDDPELEARQIPLGTATIENVVSGGGPYEIEINIPASVELPGEYYVSAIVDAADELVETDEEDNVASVEVIFSLPVAPNLLITGLTLDRASLEISTLSYDDQVNELNNNVYNADASATLGVGSDGLRVGENVDIEAFAKLRISRSDQSTSHDVPLYLWSSDQQRYMNAYGIAPDGATTAVEWLSMGTFNPQLVTSGSEVEGNFTSEGVTLDDVGRNSSLMSYYFPGKLGSELAFAMRYNCVRTDIPVVLGDPPPPTLPPPDLTQEAINALKAFLNNYPKAANCDVATNETLAMDVTDFSICVEIRPTDQLITDAIPEDNEVCSPLVITLPPVESTVLPTPDLNGYTPEYSLPSEPLNNGVGFNIRAGGSVFAFGVNFGNYATADHKGYVETLNASIPMTIFKTPFEYMAIDMRTQLVPDYEGKPAEDENKISLEIRHSGLILTSWVTVPPGEEPSILSGVEISIDQVDNLYSFSKEFPDPDKGKLLEATFYVGPIPMSAGGYVTGNMGIRIGTVDQNLNPILFTSANDDYRLGTAITPFANIEATVYGGFGSRKFIIAGVEGVLSLLSEELEFFYGVDIDLLSDGVGAEPAEFVITQGPVITNTFRGPQGKINLFAEFPVLKTKTCKIGFIKVRCPAFVRVKVKKNLVSSPAAFEFVDVLYEDPSVIFDVVLLDGQEPEYFVPGPGE
ncbi:MAG: hypothetical protein DIZ80_16910 [endosymbiont of Galathealinum brachiosum]|uniref:CARDB domain-containing protein n=1 Tax=endosymbiont of Galathealinum brachiosum TaxID=2200906 RepID=A0A370D8U4_9GAMM|nr:MAG: hypothetical protein DIZ80_16910 [endosymbiont of Galathealinum brachiosum]